MALPPALAGPIDCLLIDNFDSFTWNLYQQLCLLGAKVTVVRNDAIPASLLPQLNIKSLIISPGPGHPKTDSGVSRDAIHYFTGKVPVLGVCMGLECIVDVYGGTIGYAGEIKHGKLSPIKHDGRGCFKGVPQGIMSTRYHSLSASLKTLPKELMVTCATEESGVIMGVRHREFALEAVQYHPESILSEGGDQLIRNFLDLKGGTWRENPHSLVLDTTLPPFPYDALAAKMDRGAQQSDLKTKAPSILERIYAQRLKDVEHAKSLSGASFCDLEAHLSLHLAPPLVPIVSRLKSKTPALMAEIKRASPSKGDIALNTNAAQQALTYALAGASVISVLTEPTWFKGSLLDMRLARQAIDSLPHRPAILRKDFILDEYQIAEARLQGADTVLLIVAMLPRERLNALYAYSLSLGMEPLVEVNSAEEMQIAIDLGAKVIGVNNRNLHNFNVDMGTTSRLADMVTGRDVILCALSGIATPEDVRGYAAEGVGAVLVGESLMRAADPRAFIHQLLDWPLPPHPDEEQEKPLVKICGIKSAEDALVAAEAGADMLGLIFVPSSKRYVSMDTARSIAGSLRAWRDAKASPNGETAAEVEAETTGGDNTPWFAGHAHRFSRTLARPHRRPALVGVFQGAPLEFVQEIVTRVGLDAVQLHGAEPLEWARFISVPVIRAFHVQGPGLNANRIRDTLSEVTRPGLHSFVLLDAQRSDGLSGGSGKTVDWVRAREVVDAGEFANVNGGGTEQARMPLILAGGLTPDNVREAIERVHPWAVDVSGGVELEDGSGKDPEKVKAFVEAVKTQP